MKCSGIWNGWARLEHINLTPALRENIGPFCCIILLLPLRKHFFFHSHLLKLTFFRRLWACIMFSQRSSLFHESSVTSVIVRVINFGANNFINAHITCCWSGTALLPCKLFIFWSSCLSAQAVLSWACLVYFPCRLRGCQGKTCVVLEAK